GKTATTIWGRATTMTMGTGQPRASSVAPLAPRRRSAARTLSLAVGIGVCIGICGSLASAPARAGNDQREAKGRSLFATGDYQAALDIFVTLFGEKGDPVSLRNTGRSYQKLRQPAKASDAHQASMRRHP